MSNEQEDFNIQLDENITLEQLFNYNKASYIKGVFIITSKNLKEVIYSKKQ